MVPASKVRDSSFHLIHPGIHSTKRPCHVISTSLRNAFPGITQTRQLLHLSHALATIAAIYPLNQPVRSFLSYYPVQTLLMALFADSTVTLHLNDLGIVSNRMLLVSATRSHLVPSGRKIYKPWIRTLPHAFPNQAALPFRAALSSPLPIYPRTHLPLSPEKLTPSPIWQWQ